MQGMIDHYLNPHSIRVQLDQVVPGVAARLGFDFAGATEIFRGTVYADDKVGSLVYRGTCEGKPAVLKVVALDTDAAEVENLLAVTRCNRSTLVRVPRLYAYEPWREDRPYGVLMTEDAVDDKLFAMPFASDAEMADFARVVQEYRTQVVCDPWLPAPKEPTLAWVLARVEKWQKGCVEKGYFQPPLYEGLLRQFRAVAEKHLPTIPMTFGHGHLTANDLLRQPDGTIVMLSNVFWSWRPKHYDLAFNLWACIMHIRDLSFGGAFNVEQLWTYLERWMAAYRTIPVVAADPDFVRTMRVLMMERVVGIVLADLGMGDKFARPENLPFRAHLLDLNLRLFDRLVDELA